MSFPTSLNDALVEKRYDSLIILGVRGRLNKSLESIHPMYSDKKEFEFAPVKKEQNRDFLATFNADPPVDLTIDLYPTSESSIVTFSLNKEKSKELIEDLVNKSGFAPVKPDLSFIEQVDEMFYLQRSSYEACLFLSKRMKTNLEKVFGATWYANFLSYKGLSTEECMQFATKKYGIS